MIATEPWFSAGAAGWFSATGLLGLTALAAPFIIKGRYKATITWLWSAIIVIGLALTLAGFVAWRQHQPVHVTLPLLVTGAAIATAYAFSLIFVLRTYRQAEQRRVAAREL